MPSLKLWISLSFFDAACYVIVSLCMVLAIETIMITWEDVTKRKKITIWNWDCVQLMQIWIIIFSCMTFEGWQTTYNLSLPILPNVWQKFRPIHHHVYFLSFRVKTKTMEEELTEAEEFVKDIVASIKRGDNFVVDREDNAVRTMRNQYGLGLFINF